MLSRVYDDLGYPTDERIDTISGEAVYDLPFQHPVERYECELCGLQAHEAPHWYRGRRLCEQCHNLDVALTIAEIAARKESRHVAVPQPSPSASSVP